MVDVTERLLQRISEVSKMIGLKGTRKMKKPILISISGLLVVGGIVFCIVKKPFNQHASADPLTNPTQIEQMVEDEHQDTEASDDVSGNATQEFTESTQESSTESSTQENNTESTNQEETQDNTVSYHTETQTIHPEAETHTERQLVKEAWDETVVDQAAWDETVVDKAAWDETVTTYTTETQTIHHDGDYMCGDCGAHFTNWQDANNHCVSNEHFSGYDGTDPWDETITVQVPHTEVVHHEAVTRVVHHDAVTHVVHHDAEYKTVTVVDREAWDEEVEVQVPNN